MDAIGNPGERALAGVECVPLKTMPDARGAVLHMLRPDAPGFDGFGEIYFSEITGGAIKAWRRHVRMTQRYAVPVGRVRIVLSDSRADSPTTGRIAVWTLGREPAEYRLLIVPPGIWYGFQGIGPGISLIANCPNIPYDSTEVERCDPAASAIDYRWPATNAFISSP